jgi:hypothetical protein
MRRTIKLDDTSHTAHIGALDNYRVTIRDGEISVSPDLDARTPGAEFEAVFYGRERIEILAAPEPETQEVGTPGPERYAIGPLEPDEGETPLALAKRARLAEISEARYEEEVGGVEYLGVRMHTDRDSQSKYTGAVVALQATGTLPENWKGIDGWLEIPDGSTLMNLASAVAQHVNTCFLREKNLSDQIKAAETNEEVQGVKWET